MARKNAVAQAAAAAGNEAGQLAGGPSSVAASAAPTRTRPYILAAKDGTGPLRVIKATSETAAILFAAAQVWTCRKPSAEELFDVAQAGARMETAQ